MKIFKMIPAIALCLVFSKAFTQSETPKGFKKGTIMLTDSTIASGYMKDNIRNGAFVLFTAEAGGKKKKYDGDELIAAEIEGTKFLCVKGDFFKIIAQGELSFLQKISDASRKPSYNGNEAYFASRSEGKAGDYFFYDNRSKEMKRITKNKFQEQNEAVFYGCTAALDKAKAVNGDISLLNEAVELYNNRNNPEVINK